jgi:hypothetical protein
MADVAVVAHSGKSFGGGLRELRKVLAREGVTYPLWYEVRKSRHAPACARRAADQGAEVIFARSRTVAAGSPTGRSSVIRFATLCLGAAAITCLLRPVRRRG